LPKQTPNVPKLRIASPSKHWAAPLRVLSRAPKNALRTALVLSAVAVATAGTAVAGASSLHGSNDVGVLSAASASPSAPQASTASAATSAVRDRTQPVSRSYRRVAIKPVKQVVHRKAAKPTKVASKPARPRVAPKPVRHRTATPTPAATAVSNEGPKAIASGLLSSYGWGSGQFGCLVSLWNRESSWRVGAENASSGAYGIPQSLPGSKMASAGADWRSNPETQIRWGLGYIRDRYGSPCGAWAHSESTGWY
jgi:hypothetical protein